MQNCDLKHNFTAIHLYSDDFNHSNHTVFNKGIIFNRYYFYKDSVVIKYKK